MVVCGGAYPRFSLTQRQYVDAVLKNERTLTTGAIEVPNTILVFGSFVHDTEILNDADMLHGSRIRESRAREHWGEYQPGGATAVSSHFLAKSRHESVYTSGEEIEYDRTERLEGEDR